LASTPASAFHLPFELSAYIFIYIVVSKTKLVVFINIVGYVKMSFRSSFIFNNIVGYIFNF